MDNMDGADIESEFGKLVLHSIPTKETEGMVVSYLSRIVKNIPAEKLAQKIKITPFVLSKNIAVNNGEKIAQNLRDLGAKADFVPHNPGARGPERLHQASLMSGFELIYPKSEQNKSQQINNHPGSSGFGSRLVTAIVVIILIAVFSVLSWQLYHLLAEKFF